MNKRWPTGVRPLLKEHPKSTVLQFRIAGQDGASVSFEGRADDQVALEILENLVKKYRKKSKP